MANTGILVGGSLLRTTKLTNIKYNHKEGFIIKFTFNEKSYIHVTKVNFLSTDRENIGTAGYFEELQFLKYKSKKIKATEVMGFQLKVDQLEQGVKLDEIIVKTLQIKSPYQDFCNANNFHWTYDGGEILNYDGSIKFPAPPILKSETIEVNVHPVGRDFYYRNLPFINGLIETSQNEAVYLLTLISIQISNIQNDIFTLFTGDASLEAYITSQNTAWQYEDAFINPTLDDFKQYYANITAFYNLLYASQISIKEVKTKTKFFWLAYVLSEEALAIVPALLKVELLRSICYGPVIEKSMLIDLMALNPLPGLQIKPVINHEEIVLKIVKSILFSSNQVDSFLGYLITIYEANEKKTLFEILYNKIDDFGGSDNLKIMMNTLYRIWASSSLYPYNLDGTVKSDLINNIIYANKPIDIGYKSDKVLLFFHSSNYDFDFSESEILVYGDVDHITEYTVETERVLVGKYDIYQSISINKKDSDEGSSAFTFVEVKKENNQIEQLSVLPIFYLKYLDDKKDTENLITGLSLTVDVVLTLTGVGNLSKLRHLRSVYKLGRVALGLEPLVPGTVLASFEFARGIVGVVEITASIGSIFIQYGNQLPTYCTVGSPTYDKAKCEFYTKLNGWFLALQIIAPALDFATSKLISNSAKKILEGPIPNDFDPDALGILRKFAGENIIELKQIFKERLIAKFGEDSPIWLKLQNLDSTKQADFIMDFGKAENNVLEALNADDRLIDGWSEIVTFDGRKTEVSFLKNYYRFAHLKPNEVDHIWLLTGTKGGHRAVYVTANLNGSELYKIVSVAETNTTIPLDLRTKITNINGHLYYENLYRYNPNNTSGFLLNGQKVSRKPRQFVINPAWDKQRLTEEMTFAYNNRGVATEISEEVIRYNATNYSIINTTYISTFSDGTKVKIQYKTKGVDPISGLLVDDHIALLSIEP